VRQYCLIAAILLLGALALSPAVAALGLDPMPGDIMFRWNDTPVIIPVIYSLCASVGLGLFYKIMKR
jgi:protein-S-isoprenylcysteine O-methyltransferase Ste14